MLQDLSYIAILMDSICTTLMACPVFEIREYVGTCSMSVGVWKGSVAESRVAKAGNGMAYVF